MKPVYLFGYGSLIWRPSFNFTAKKNGYIKGFKRRFWQACRFHRGTDEKPGRVVTLIPSENPEEIVHGVIYELPHEEVNAILQHLDVREQGGYVRQFVQVYVTSDETEASKETVIEAVLYVGSEQNPEYAGPSETLELDAEIIATSIGPSGHNTEYLFNLAKSLRMMKAHDDHIFTLEELVREYLTKQQTTSLPSPTSPTSTSSSDN